MKVVMYTSCYGLILQEILITYFSSYQVFVFKWYEEDCNFDLEFALIADIFICEYLNNADPNLLNKNLNSDNIIFNLKKLNPKIKIITYPLIKMYIYPFYQDVRCRVIDELLQKFTKDEIIKLYDENKIDWKYKDSFIYSISKIQDIEKLYAENNIINVSNFLLENYKSSNIFLDKVMPSSIVLNFIFENIIKKIDKSVILNINVNLDIILNSPAYIYHLNNHFITSGMVKELNLNLCVTPYAELNMRNKLLYYLEQIQSDDIVIKTPITISSENNP
jgi:hypothetical protein